MTKLLILTTIYPRGTTELPGNKVHGKFVRDFAKQWVKKGIEVHVLTPHSINTRSYEILDGIHVHRFHYFFRECWETLTYGDGIPQNIQRTKNKLLVPFLSFAFFWNAIRLIRSYDIINMNAHWAIPAGYIGLWIKKWTGVRLVTTVYGAELFPVFSGRMTALKPFLTHAINGADFIAGISAETANAARALSNNREVFVIPDGIDTEYYKPGPPDVRLLEKYGSAEKRVIFFSGRMVERKGHRCLLEAMRHVKQSVPDVKLILGGRGPLFDELVALRKQWGLEDVVEMPGFIKEKAMVPLLQSSQLFVLPSCTDRFGDTEGSATAALEAMACGTPALISKIGGNIGAIQEGKGAYYFEPMNAFELGKKIRFLLENPDNLKKLSKAARDFVVSNYSWDRIVKIYLQHSGLIQSSGN